MTSFVSARFPRDQVHPFTLETYAHVERWVRETGRSELGEGFFSGDASAIVLASDVLLQRGTPTWDACGPAVVGDMGALLGLGLRCRALGAAVVAFRRWLSSNGHAGDAGMDALERFVDQLVDDASEPSPSGGNRHERRVRERAARRGLRKR